MSSKPRQVAQGVIERNLIRWVCSCDTTHRALWTKIKALQKRKEKNIRKFDKDVEGLKGASRIYAEQSSARVVQCLRLPRTVRCFNLLYGPSCSMFGMGKLMLQRFCFLAMDFRSGFKPLPICQHVFPRSGEQRCTNTYHCVRYGSNTLYNRTAIGLDLPAMFSAVLREYCNEIQSILVNR